MRMGKELLALVDANLPAEIAKAKARREHKTLRGVAPAESGQDGPKERHVKAVATTSHAKKRSAAPSPILGTAKAARKSENGLFTIYSGVPRPEKTGRPLYLPWRELAVGESYFVPGKRIKVTKTIHGCEGRKFVSSRGIHEHPETGEMVEGTMVWRLA